MHGLTSLFPQGPSVTEWRPPCPSLSLLRRVKGARLIYGRLRRLPFFNAATLDCPFGVGGKRWLVRTGSHSRVNHVGALTQNSLETSCDACPCRVRGLGTVVRLAIRIRWAAHPVTAGLIRVSPFLTRLVIPDLLQNPMPWRVKRTISLIPSAAALKSAQKLSNVIRLRSMR